MFASSFLRIIIKKIYDIIKKDREYPLTTLNHWRLSNFRFVKKSNIYVYALCIGYFVDIIGEIKHIVDDAPNNSRNSLERT
jgi:hypothetical protein